MSTPIAEFDELSCFEVAPSVRWQGPENGILGSATPVAVPFGDGRIVFREPPPTWAWELIRRICTLGDLSEDWDSYGARRIDPSCATAAIELILSVLGPLTPAPAIVPTIGGGLQLEWHRAGVDLEIAVEASHRFHVAFEDQQTGEEIQEIITTDVRPLAPWIERISRTQL